MWDIMIEFPDHQIDLWDVYEILLASLSKNEIMEFVDRLASFCKPIERTLDEFEFVMEG